MENLRSLERSVWRRGTRVPGLRAVPEEVPVAFTYGGSTHAVMMASPSDLEDFAIGFSLTEGVIRSPADVVSLDVLAQPDGIELRMWLWESPAQDYAQRRRRAAGPTGCGLCGIESLSEAKRLPPLVPEGRVVTDEMIAAALASLTPAQILNQQTRAAHAAAFWNPDKGLVAMREDVGRHNALDKLGGHLSRNDISVAGGLILLTSRVSVEMVQKAAILGAPMLVAVSAPTALAVEMAELAGMTLVAIAREDGFEVFSRPDRIHVEVGAHAA